MKLLCNVIYKILTVKFADLHIGHIAGRSSGSCSRRNSKESFTEPYCKYLMNYGPVTS